MRVEQVDNYASRSQRDRLRTATVDLLQVRPLPLNPVSGACEGRFARSSGNALHCVACPRLAVATDSLEIAPRCVCGKKVQEVALELVAWMSLIQGANLAVQAIVGEQVHRQEFDPPNPTNPIQSSPTQ